MRAGWIVTAGLEACLALIAGAARADAAPQGRPNILFILSDDHRWDSLGIAGNRGVRTPALDGLARTGVWFRQATIHVPQCSPSRSTLLTGLAPHQHRWYGNQYHHPDVKNPDGFHGLPTLPGLLLQAGYRTLFVGKWHGRPEPWNCGFSNVRTWLVGGSGPYLDPELAHGRSRELHTAKGYAQEIFANDAISFIESPEATERPFFFWLAFTARTGLTSPIPGTSRNSSGTRNSPSSCHRASPWIRPTSRVGESTMRRFVPSTSRWAVCSGPSTIASSLKTPSSPSSATTAS